MDKNISTTISSVGETVANWASEWSATANSRAHQVIASVAEESKIIGTNALAAAQTATQKVEVLASDAATYVEAHEGAAIAVGVTAGLIGLDILTRGRADKVTQFLQGATRPNWEKQAEQLTLLKRYPTSNLDVSSGFRLSWHSKPVLTEESGSAWITRTTETSPNSAEMLKSSGASLGAGLTGFPTIGAVSKGLEQVGVASKGKIIEKMNEQIGDYVRIKETSGLSLKVGPLAYESPRTSTFTDYQLGEAWKQDQKGGAFVRVTKSDSGSGHQYTSIEFTTEEGQHMRRAWANRDGVHTRIDSDLTRDHLTFIQRDASGAVTDKIVVPRRSPFHIMARVNRQLTMNLLEGTQVSDAALTRLLNTHVFADPELMGRL